MRSITKSRRAQFSLLGIIIGLAVGLLVIAYIVPPAIQAITDVNTTGWDADVTNLWDVIPIMGMLGLFLAIIYFAIKHTG